MPRELERHLVVAPISAEALAPALAGEGPRMFPLTGALAEYGDWDLVSHSLEVRDDGTAIFTAVFETKVRSGNHQQASDAPKEERRRQREEKRQQRRQERQQRKEKRRQERQGR